MSSFILHLLEASLVLMMLYGAYRLLLSKETFFGFNRFFLMAILILSLLFPLLSFELVDSDKNFINQQSTELGKARNAYHTRFENWSEWALDVPANKTSRWQQFWSGDYDFWQIMMALVIVIYFMGLIYRLFRLSLGYIKIYFLKKKLVLTDFDGFKVTEIPSHMAPFSFLNTVFIPDSIEDETEYSQILAHEKTHIQQRHSIDLIFVQLVAAFLWFNPVVWLLLKSLKQTHEYIADKNMLRQGFSLVEYQSLLLRQLISDNSYGLVHNFNLSFIKKRITMMSIKESDWTGKSKAIVALVLVLAMGTMTAQSNIMLDIPETKISQGTKVTAPKTKFYIDDVLLSEGLSFSKLSDYKGQFKFELENDKADDIHVGLDLVRKGNVIARVSQKLNENEPMNIGQLLSGAQKEDYLVIDIIEGPSEMVKLHNIPLFRENKVRVRNPESDLPPPPVALYVEGTAMGPQKGMTIAALKAANSQIEYEISEFVDFSVITRQGGKVKASLLRGGETILSVLNTEIKRKATIELKELLTVAKKGDEIMVQFGKPDGLSFGTNFPIK